MENNKQIKYHHKKFEGTVARSKKERREIGKGEERGETRYKVLLYICNQYPENTEAYDVSDYLREIFNIRTQTMIYKHLNNLNQEKLIINIRGSKKEGKWKVNDDKITFLEILKICKNHNLLDEFIETPYCSNLTNTYIFDLIKEVFSYKEQLPQYIKDCVRYEILKIIKSSPTAYALLINKNVDMSLFNKTVIVKSENVFEVMETGNIFDKKPHIFSKEENKKLELFNKEILTPLYICFLVDMIQSGKKIDIPDIRCQMNFYH